MRYLKGTKTYGLKFTSSGADIKCYPDISLGLNDSKGKSHQPRLNL